MKAGPGQAAVPVLREVAREDARPERAQGGTWAARGASLAVLGCLLAGLAGLGSTLFGVFADAWVGPAHLSPDDDQVLSLRLRVNQQLAEMARVEAEVVRVDGELAAIDTAVARLSAQRANPAAALAWTAEAEGRVAEALVSSREGLRAQIALIESLRERQTAVLDEVRAAAAAGLETDAAVEREQTALVRLDLALAESRRQLEDVRAKARAAEERAARLRAGVSGPGAAPRAGVGRLPEVVAREEQETRLELELVRLEAERRGLEALRRAAVSGLERTRALLEETRARPLYRAMEAATDVAFVPYEHLEAVAPGHRVLRCVWGVFLCRDVGRVSEVLPGEVITQDPWGELARGRYAILALHEADAIQERTLRVRGR